jgi:hypothetical protein
MTTIIPLISSKFIYYIIIENTAFVRKYNKKKNNSEGK